MIPLAIPNLDGNERRYLNECVDTGFVSSVGAFVDRFERDVASLAGSAHAIATSSGTTALHLALVGAGVGRDDLVILPTYTFIASANAISHCGASPWLIDVVEDGWTLDPDLVSAALAQETERRGDALMHRATGRRVSAIMPVFTMGVAPDMDRFAELARNYGLKLIADGAAALGSRYKGRELGASGALATGVSFNGNKTFTTGSGGAILTNDDALAVRLKHLCTTARLPGGYMHDQVGFNYRMSNIEAAVGCAQLERAEAFLAAKKRAAERYRRFALADGKLGAFPEPAYAQHCWWFSGVLLEPGLDATKVQEALRAGGVDSRPFWTPMHHQPPYRDCPRRLSGVADAIAPRMIVLPSSTDITDAQLDTVEGALAAALAIARAP